MLSARYLPQRRHSHDRPFRLTRRPMILVMYQNLFDSHTHSENSPDGVHSIIFMAETALERNMQGLAITDHCECDSLEQYSYEKRLMLTAVDVAKAGEAFRGRIIITNGIELGHPLYDYKGAQNILERRHFDFVLLSHHRMRGWQSFAELDYSALTPDALHNMMLQYFEELLEMIAWGNFDALAHLNLPLRYSMLRCGVHISLSRYADQVDEVLKALIRGDKGLELNTSGLRNNLRDTLPPIWVAQRYRELGGKYVTIGSDAHNASDVGAGVRDGMHLLLENGFEHFAFYRDRKPFLLRII